jgi:hypothetical protein
MTRPKEDQFFTTETQRNGVFKVFEFDQFVWKFSVIAGYPTLKPYFSLCLCVSVVH